MKENDLSRKIIGKAIDVHSGLGPGLLESAYQECLYYELSGSGLWVEKEKALPLIYKQVKLESGYRIDLWVERTVIIEIKAVEGLANIHTAQLITYLKLTGCKLGLLLNFNVQHMKDGIKRVVNKF